MLQNITMKRVYKGIVIALAVVTIGALIDASNIFAKSETVTPTVVATLIVAGMVLGIVFAQEWRDVKERKKELFST